MADITRIAMKHQDCEILAQCCRWSSDVECGKLLSIGSGYHKLFEVGKTELRGSGDIGAGEVRDVGGVDESSVCRLLAIGAERKGRVDGGAHTFA
jgi:hypothetical protein